MKQSLQRETTRKSDIAKLEPGQKAIHNIARSKAQPLAQLILGAIRIRKSNQPPKPWAVPATHPEEPRGPYTERYRDAAGDLLVFVPRSIESFLLDHATGAYGYSHVAIDTGEVEVLTQQRVMIESTVNHPVSRAYQNKYGQRPYIRIPLRQVGIDSHAFCDCVQSKLGEPYDNLEALTWGEVDDPAKQICSDLAADCLPEAFRQNIASDYNSKRLRWHTLSIHRHPDGSEGIFVSPNGFAQFFGAPLGRKIKAPDTVIQTDRRLLRKPENQKGIPPWQIGVVIGGAVGVACLLAAKILRLRLISKERAPE
jgi:hypothetical protein